MTRARKRTTTTRSASARFVYSEGWATGALLTAVQEGAGFIADEDEDEEEEISRKERRRRKKRKNREEDEALDEEDLDLIGVEVEPREQSQVRSHGSCLAMVLTVTEQVQASEARPQGTFPKTTRHR